MGAVVVATGFEEYDVSETPVRVWDFENVLTQMELARVLGINGPTKELLRISDFSKASSDPAPSTCDSRCKARLIIPLRLKLQKG